VRLEARAYNIQPQDLRRHGRIFLHSICGGWVCYDIDVNIKNKHKKSRDGYQRVSATARSY